MFIPIAERTGRIVELGDWALRRALTDFSRQPGDPRRSLAVNVSPRQLVGGRLVATVAEALAESGVEPSRLVLKIDQSFIRTLTPGADTAVLAAIIALGAALGLDVVGEGVETAENLAVLRDMGCDEYQGFIDGGPGLLHEVLAPMPAVEPYGLTRSP